MRKRNARTLLAGKGETVRRTPRAAILVERKLFVAFGCMNTLFGVVQAAALSVQLW